MRVGAFVKAVIAGLLRHIDTSVGSVACYAGYSSCRRTQAIP
jgi:hypothetical protein